MDGNAKEHRHKKKVRFIDEPNYDVLNQLIEEPQEHVADMEAKEDTGREKIDKSFTNGKRGTVLGIPVKTASSEVTENVDLEDCKFSVALKKSFPRLGYTETHLKPEKEKERIRCLPVTKCFGPYANFEGSGGTDSPRNCHNESFMDRISRWNKAADNIAENLWIHVNMGGSISDTIWGKLSLGAKIVTGGGVENLFRETFIVGPQEKLLKTSACYLSTTSGPIAGLLFVSTQKVAFCSERPIALLTSKGATYWSYYKVSIPLSCVASVSPSENVYRPVEKYIRLETIDNYEFWFMGFVQYDKALRYLQHVLVASKTASMK